MKDFLIYFVLYSAEKKEIFNYVLVDTATVNLHGREPQGRYNNKLHNWKMMIGL